ncbi:MAG: MFS transporter [Acidimicrobiales bacterium]
MVVLAAFAAQFVTFGVLYSFGVVLDDVGADLGRSTSAVALVPAVAAFTLFSVGPFSGRLRDRGGTHVAVALAALVLPAGLVVTSVATQLWVAVVGFGVLGGAAVGAVYVPLVAHVVSLPARRSTLHAGIVIAGVTVGPALVAPLLGAASDEFGWRATYRVYAAAAAVVLLAVAMVLSRSHQPGQSTAVPGWRSSLGHLFGQGRFLRLYAAMLLVAPSLYAGLLFFPDYAAAQHLSGRTGAVLVTTVGLSSAAGRVVLAGLAGRGRALSVFRGSMVLLGLSSLLWASAGATLLVLFIAAVGAGVGYGGVLGVAPTIVALTQPGEQLGATLGLLYTALGVGGLLTGPTVGATIDRAGHRPALIGLAVTALAGAVLVPSLARNTTPVT